MDERLCEERRENCLRKFEDVEEDINGQEGLWAEVKKRVQQTTFQWVVSGLCVFS